MTVFASAVVATGDWIVVADPLGVDKALHVGIAAVSVVVLSGRLGLMRSAAAVLGAGIVLELIHGTTASLGLQPPSPLGGTAELADVIADGVGVVLGLAIAYATRAGPTPSAVGRTRNSSETTPSR